jgi:hypothetical protein
MDETIILVKKGDKWECRYWSRPMGAMPIGPRLARKDSLPPLATVASTRMEGVEIQSMWQQWLDARPLRKFKKR